MMAQTDIPTEVASELEKTNSERLRSRIEALLDAVEENPVDQTVEVEIHYDDSDLTSISIKPEEDWHKEGERGFDSAHLVLGPRGGLTRVTIRSVMTGAREYHNEKYGWEKFLSAVGRMA